MQWLNKAMLKLLIENILVREDKIMAEWKKIVLAEVLVEKGYIRGPFGSALKRGEMKESGIPVYEQQHAIYDSRYFRYFVDEQKFSEMKRYQVHKDDLIISCSGTVGKVSIIREKDPKGIISQALLLLRVNKNKILPLYLKYYLLSQEGYNAIISRSSGSVQVNLAKRSVIEQIPLMLPNLETQKRIVEVLNSIDEKIELNNRINNNLFEQMQALYKAWFVDFAPFGGVRPSNWNNTNIYAIANIIYGAPFASKLFNTDGIGKPIIRIRDLKEQAFVTFTTEEHAKGHLIQPGDIVVGMDGEFRPYIWGNEPAWLNQRVCIFKSNRPQGKAFVLYTIKPLLNKIEQTQVATTVIHIGKKDFNAFEIILPDEATLDSFDSITAPMIEQIVNNRLQNKKFAVLRDTLLPKLMSGELNVSNIDL